ncbi:hypothetical protein [Nocardia transvalensis]|uniref:hypothetical protein n=1 Tax=Nocardia transvalensis TaxID=37333 RepID=UPI001895998F|nr:hypothetical protein [Nocardia transvalensis]MBF6333562.1 hypothetical protein [Nocardia transvalensis]
MTNVIQAVAILVGMAAVFFGAIVWDRLRETYRDPLRPFAVASEHDYRNAVRRFDLLVARGEWAAAWMGATAICGWLRHERRYGSARRRRRFETRLQQWEHRRGECSPFDKDSER